MGHFGTVTGADGAYEFANPAGMYLFEELRAGDYAVGISGYPTEEYRFDVTSVNVTIGLEETATADFAGIMLRTAAISGQVTVSGDGLGGVHVTVDGEGENHVVATDPGATTRSTTCKRATTR